MNNIILIEKFELGRNKPMNDRLRSRVSIVTEILSALDNEGIKAEILLIADTTSFNGELKWEINCEQKEFKRLIKKSFHQFVMDF